MSGILFAKELRRRFFAVIADAGISLDVDGAAVPVTVLSAPPAGWQVTPEKLPAVYAFNTGEEIRPVTLDAVERTLALDVVLMAKGSDGDPGDQLDDLQLEIERAMIASGLLDGAANRLALQSVSIAQEQGRTLFGVRVMRYEITAHVTADDPTF